MARKLSTKQNVIAPAAPYSFGRIKDNPGDNTGTPFNESLYGDIQQFFEKMFAEGGLTFNNLPENDANGYQFFQSLQNNIFKYKSIVPTFGSTTISADSFGGLVVTVGAGIQTLPIAVAGGINDGRSITFLNTSGGSALIIPPIGNALYGATNGTVELTTGDTITITQYSAGIYWVTNKYTLGSGTKVIPIGPWAMSTTATKTVAHGLTLDKIVSVSASIISDASNSVTPLTAMVITSPGGGLYADPTNINLRRFSDAEAPNLYTGSISAFGNGAFSDPTMNRGWITIEYAI